MKSLVSDAKIGWLKDVPGDWTTVRVKNLFSLSKEKNMGEVIPILSLTQKGIKVRDISDNEGQIAESYESYTRVRPGDIVFNPMDLRSGSVDLSKTDGVISLAYTIIRKRRNKEINLRYFSYYFYWHYIQQILFPYGRGVSVDHRWTLQDDTLLNFPVLLPPIESQKLIAEYIDKNTELIDQVIEKKQKLIDLLQEKRSALITLAVTKGLDPKAKMKPSSIDWIKGIPETWKVEKLKNNVRIYGRIGFRGYTVEDIVAEGDGAITLSPSNIKDDNFDLNSSVYISWQKYEESPEIKIFGGDIIFVKTGSTIGKVAIVEDKENIKMTLNPQMVVFKNIRINNYYLYYFMSSKMLKNQIYSQIMGGSTPSLNQQKISSLNIIVPPSVVQNQIVIYLKSKLKKIDALVNRINFQIDKLNEYRSSLIYHAVTGKVKI